MDGIIIHDTIWYDVRLHLTSFNFSPPFPFSSLSPFSPFSLCVLSLFQTHSLSQQKSVSHSSNDTLTHNHYKVSLTSDASHSILSFSLTLTPHAWLLRLVHRVIYIVKEKKIIRGNGKREWKKGERKETTFNSVSCVHHQRWSSSWSSSNQHTTHSLNSPVNFFYSLSLSLSRFSFLLSLAFLSLSLSLSLTFFSNQRYQVWESENQTTKQTTATSSRMEGKEQKIPGESLWERNWKRVKQRERERERVW